VVKGKNRKPLKKSLNQSLEDTGCPNPTRDVKLAMRAKVEQRYAKREAERKVPVEKKARDSASFPGGSDKG